ncbi:MAG: hypothetical protein RMA76_26600 [Deltaproteobacteria bacterium]|jgi:hypothetical protein
MRTALLLAALLVPSTALADQIVVPQVATSGVDEDIATLVTELILEALLNRHGVKALGPSDVKDMLNLEQQKMLMGCDQNSCMAELAGAMGAKRVVAGRVGRLGSLFVVTLKLVDTTSAQIIARASRRFDKVERVPEAVGPLVDDLLQSKPRTQTTAPILETSAPREKKETMHVRELCKAAEKYAERLRKQAWDRARVQERTAMLEDLLYTPFLKEFDEKVGCVNSWGGRVRSDLFRDLYRSTTEKDADDRRRRLLEWIEMERVVPLLVEAYHVGFEKEKHGAGRRPAKLPFRIETREPDRPADTEEVRRFIDDYASAQQVLGQALAAGKKKKQKSFEGLWTPEDPNNSRTSLKYVFDSVSNYWKNGYAVDLCPLFILAASEIEDSAKDYAKDGKLDACFRRQKGTYVTRDRVAMKKVGSKWRVDRW